MAFRKYKGKTVTRWYPVAASTAAMTKGSIASLSSGLIIAATSSTTALSHVGVIKKTIATTDADYATARLVPIEVPVEKGVVWEADVTATLVVGDVGLEVDLTDALTINRGAASVKAAICVGFQSTTKGLFVLELGAGKF